MRIKEKSSTVNKLEKEARERKLEKRNCFKKNEENIKKRI